MLLFLQILDIILGVYALGVFVWVYRHHLRILKDDKAKENLKGHVRQHLYIINFAFINSIMTIYIALRDISIESLDYTNMNYYGLISLFSTVIFGGIHYIRELKTEEYS